MGNLLFEYDPKRGPLGFIVALMAAAQHEIIALHEALLAEDFSKFMYPVEVSQIASVMHKLVDTELTIRAHADNANLQRSEAKELSILDLLSDGNGGTIH